MSLKPSGLTRSARILTAIVLGATLLAGAFMISSNTDAQAEPVVLAKKKKKTKVLGAVGRFPDALCPQNCEALAIVSGFQAEIKGVGNPYRIPYNGFITKWKIGLGSVTKSQRRFFAKRFGSKPKAQLSVLKAVKVDGQRKFRLMKRGPVAGLNKYLGSVSSIKLKKRIPVKKGWFVALTVPTWAPALWRSSKCNVVDNMVVDPSGCDRVTDTYSWRASRERNTCNQDPNMNNSEPQQKVHSARTYGCRFDGAQLLYRVKVTNR